jgi:hypothetical protein
MTLEKLAKALAASVISMAAAAAVSAAVALPQPKAPAAPVIEAEAPVELAHGCHRGIRRDYQGWHFHTGACVRRNTAPPGLYDNPSYRRWYRTPVCSYKCRFVGPVKTCQQVCR